jgi:predicted metal-dependent hydrolase
MVRDWEGHPEDPHYVGYFECFNRQLFFEAHDVLEQLWLAEGKSGENYAFYKGLIQLAGAFVHLQKDRIQPAGALFRLAEANLARYPSPHQRLDIGRVMDLIQEWKDLLQPGRQNPLASKLPPNLEMV